MEEACWRPFWRFVSVTFWRRLSIPARLFPRRSQTSLKVMMLVKFRFLSRFLFAPGRVLGCVLPPTEQMAAFEGNTLLLQLPQKKTSSSLVYWFKCLHERYRGQYELVRRQTTAGTTNSRVKPSQLLCSSPMPQIQCAATKLAPNNTQSRCRSKVIPFLKGGR